MGTKSRGTSSRKGGKRQQKPKTQSAKKAPRSTPRGEKPKPGEKKVPPAYLHPTSSPHAYIASCAAMEMGIDPRQLYVDASAASAGSAGNNKPDSFRSSRFEYVSPKALGHELPTFGIPEVTFLGKSNVGKSSLINALTNRRDLARISKRPGRTQQVNYFALIKNDKVLDQGGGKVAFRPSDATGYLVDLPGYGYAAAPDDKVSEWQANTQKFLLERRDASLLPPESSPDAASATDTGGPPTAAFKRVYLLIDARHGVAQFDRTVMGWFDEASIPYTVVLTKADRVSKAKVVRFVNDVCMRYHSQMYGDGGAGYQGPVVHVTSSKTGEGVRELMWSIDGDFCAPAAADAAVAVGGGTDDDFAGGGMMMPDDGVDFADYDYDGEEGEEYEYVGESGDRLEEEEDFFYETDDEGNDIGADGAPLSDDSFEGDFPVQQQMQNEGSDTFKTGAAKTH